ncbi:hypothetical protein, partial [Acinetobacter baumannii]|uniref:hypothetical protein n=1 Tax=Acinetobacter baumannii TaxID=470 RepID=UPI0025A02A94
MIHIDYPVIILFTALMYWPVTLIVLATLIAISYSYREALLHKHSKAEFSPIHSNLRHNLGAR